MKRTGAATIATMLAWKLSETKISASEGGGTGESGGDNNTKQVYPEIEVRKFFRPDANVVTPYPATKGSAPNAVDISNNATVTFLAVSAVKDTETVTSGAASYTNNYNNTGIAGYIYEVHVTISYVNIVH